MYIILFPAKRFQKKMYYIIENAAVAFIKRSNNTYETHYALYVKFIIREKMKIINRLRY